MAFLDSFVDLTQPSLYVALVSILFNPLFWNVVARLEFKHQSLTKLAFGSPYLGCYALALTIFSLGIVRDHLYQSALALQPKAAALAYGEVKVLAAALFALGATLVVSSMWALGVTGTYLGDYFGILMDEKVESFPFNVTNNPMYYGSTLSFLATALWFESPVGIFLSLVVFVEYKIALLFEEPFTGAIYAAREERRAAEKRQTRGGTTALERTSSAVRRR